MKKVLLIVIISVCEIAKAQNTWIQKTDFGGAGREVAVGFSIGNKGYIGTGYDGAFSFYKDFWEYDPVTNAWTQKADFGGSARYYAVGFSIGNKGYIGAGEDSLAFYLNDFWEYDPLANIWTQKANFIGIERYSPIGFSIGNKGYVGLGGEGNWNGNPVDFYEYDQLTDTWTQKSNFPGAGRVLAVSFTIGNKGYVGTGTDENMNCFNDFWEYDPAINVWTQKANFAGVERQGAIGFSIGNRGYIGLGQDFCSTGGTTRDFWEYNPTINAWKNRVSPITAPDEWDWATSFTIAGNGYMGTGAHWGSNPNLFTEEFYQYTPDTANSGCAASFILYPDTIPHTYMVVNNAAGTSPLTYLWSWGDGNFSSGATPSHTYSTAGFYTICLNIADAFGCVDSFCYLSYLSKYNLASSIVTVNVISNTTGFNENNLENLTFSLFPNPANEFTVISSEFRVGDKIRVTDVLGKTIFTKIFSSPASNFKLQTLSYTPGIYFVEVISEKGKAVKKIVKE